MYNILIFLQKLLTFFSIKFQHICVSLDVNFNDSLTNDVDSFEQLGPDHCPPVYLELYSGFIFIHF